MTNTEVPGPARVVRAAAIAYLAPAVGFGLAAPLTLQHLARTGELPMTPWGFRSMAGPFEALGQARFTALGLALAGVCALDALAAIWLWQGRRRGAVLGVMTTPGTLALGAGFALPFLLAAVPVRLALLLAGRRRLRR